MADKIQAENDERQKQEEEMKKRLKDAQEVVTLSVVQNINLHFILGK